MPAPIPASNWSLTRAGIALVTAEDGTIDGGDATGLYVRDRRIVAGMEVRINGTRPVVLRGVRTGPSLRPRRVRRMGRCTRSASDRRANHRPGGGYSDRFVLRCFREPMRFDVEIELAGRRRHRLPPRRRRGWRRAARRRCCRRHARPGDFALDGMTLRATVDLAPGQTRALGFSIRNSIRRRPPSLPPSRSLRRPATPRRSNTSRPRDSGTSRP